MLNLARLLTVGILARKLGPGDFGVVALASTVLRFILLFSEGGTNSYIVFYQEEDWREEAKAVFWFNQAVTLLQASVVVIAIVVFLRFLDQADLVLVMIALLGVFVL